MFTRKTKALALITLFINAQAATLLAQTDAPPPPPPLSNEELEQVVAPIALYPDSLLSQILMASTYPIEVVQADRFVKANPNLTGDALTDQLENQSWDPSVKSLVNFPTVLSMMSEHLDATIKLGDAFIADQKSVMDAVQRLRFKAQAAGNLNTTPQQTIIVEQAPQTTVQVIRIEPANPKIIYVPTYNPVIVYGPWPYPAYRPYYYYPPGYVATAAVIGFGVGFACGAAWGYAWGRCNWGRSSNINININQNVNINTKINRTKYEANFNRNGNRNNTFEHNPAHRRGVAYRDNSTGQRFGNGSPSQAIQSREPFRGRGDTTNNNRGQNTPSLPDRPGSTPGRPGSNPNRPSTADIKPGANRPSTADIKPGTNRPSTADIKPGQNRPTNLPANSTLPTRNTTPNFNGVGGGGNSTREASQRGNSSRTSTPNPTGASRPSAPTTPRPTGGGAAGARGR